MTTAKTERKKKKYSLNEKGAVSYFIVFLTFSFILLILFAIFTPALIEMNTKLYLTAEDTFDKAIADANKIQDANIRTTLGNTFQTAKETIPTQSIVLSDFFKFGFIIIIVLTLVTLFMFVRQKVEMQKGGGIQYI